MKQIPLSGKSGTGKFAIIDDEDFEKVNQYNWCLNDKGYAISYKKFKVGQFKQIKMHRLILDAPQKQGIDHIDRNKLNNQKYNLRFATQYINAINTGLRIDNKSGFKGISWEKTRNKYRVLITVNKKTKYLGRFNILKNAIEARQKAERIFYYV